MKVKEWLPPVFFKAIRKLRGGQNRYEGSYKAWLDAAALCSGYDSTLILDKVLEATLKVKNGEAVCERDSVLFEKIQYSWPVTAALLWASSRSNGNLNVLDFGGALGSSYYQNRKFISKLRTVSWHVVEQEHFVKVGRNYIEDNVLKFYGSIKESTQVQIPNVVLLSSVVQYLPNLDELLIEINSVNSSVLIFDKTPFIRSADNCICIQHVSKEIYNASYPMWLLSVPKLMDALTNWQMVEDFSTAEGSMVTSYGKEFEFGGYIFDRKHG